MKLPPLTREQVRQVDQIAIDQYGMPGIALMENAGRGAAEIIGTVAPHGLVVILCGGGNNGGDGYVIARHLQLAERDVRIVSLVPLSNLRGDAQTNAAVAAAADIAIQIATEPLQLKAQLDGAAVIVDCLLGTGARGALREPFSTAVCQANAAAGVRRIAIDIPTGLDCDTGVAADPTFSRRSHHHLCVQQGRLCRRPCRPVGRHGSSGWNRRAAQAARTADR